MLRYQRLNALQGMGIEVLSQAAQKAKDEVLLLFPKAFCEWENSRKVCDLFNDWLSFPQGYYVVWINSKPVGWGLTKDSAWVNALNVFFNNKQD